MDPFAIHPHLCMGKLSHHSFIFSSLIFCPKLYDQWRALCVTIVKVFLNYHQEIQKIRQLYYHPSLHNTDYFFIYRPNMLYCLKTSHQFQTQVNLWKFSEKPISLMTRCYSLQFYSCFYSSKKNTKYFQARFP